MMRKAFLLGIVLSCILSCKKQVVVSNGKFPIMTFAQKQHDFGPIDQTAKVSYDFEFKNTGAADLIISSASGSCGCTIPEYPKEPIPAGGSGILKVSFNAAGKSGQQLKTVTIITNTASGKEMLSIKASITPSAGKTSGITSS